MELRDKVVLITGGSSGIGAAAAMAFAAEGAKLALAARNTDKLAEIIAALPAGTEAIAVGADVADEEEVKHLITRTNDRFGQIDVLVNSAGYGLFKPVTEMTMEEFDDVIRVNLRGVFLTTKYILPQMYEQQGGTIITISSLAGRNGFAGGAAYCASKFGVMGVMESIFHEARAHNVRIVTICPGSVNTPFFDDSQMTPPMREAILQPEDVAAAILLAARLPENALIREMDIRPTNPKRNS